MSKAANTLQTLRDYESQNITYLDPDGTWPIVWDRAKGVNVWDVNGRKYLDLTAAFGVANAGHANPAVVCAGQRQMGKLIHAMGDVHPHALKGKLAKALSQRTFERWSLNKRKGTTSITGKTIFCNSGFEAVEAALKTARLATGKDGIVAFEGGYHGLGYGALNATHRDHFRRSFVTQLGQFGQFVSFPTQAGSMTRRAAAERLLQTKTALCKALDRSRIGAILVEPIQARGGINVPPRGFLKLLRQLCDEHGTLLIFDEIYTGFGRTGKWFACEHEGVMPDLVCLGKGMTGGFPMSACVGRSDLMDAAWPPSNGEAIHTSTFLGHPVGCAMALAQISEIKRLNLIERSEQLGELLLAVLRQLQPTSSSLNIEVRGLGLMAGVELSHRNGTPATNEAMAAIKAMLQRGYVMLPEGGHSNVISFTPPLTITAPALRRSVAQFQQVFKEF